MDKLEQRRKVREERLAGKSPQQLAEEMGITRAWVYKLLEPTTEDPTTVRSCVTCKKPFLTDTAGYGFCSPQCEDRHENPARQVVVQVEDEVWRALGREPGEVTGVVVRDLLRGLAAGVRRKREG